MECYAVVLKTKHSKSIDSSRTSSLYLSDYMKEKKMHRIILSNTIYARKTKWMFIRKGDKTGKCNKEGKKIEIK